MATKAATSEQIELGEGEVLFRQDDPATRVFVVNSGHVQLVRRAFREEFVVETIGPGNLCGEVALAGGARYTLTAIALSPVKALAVAREDIDAQLLSNKDIAARLAQRMATRLSYSHFRLGAFSLRSSRARIMLQLRYEAMRHGALGGEAFAPIPYDLPEVLSLERGGVDRALRSLVEDALIEVDGHGRFRIMDTTGFDRLLHYLELRDRFNDQ